MKKYLSVLTIIIINVAVYGQAANWKIAGDKIATSWASQVNPTNVHQDYPRPQMVRETWMNLNGLWEYAILPKEEMVSGYQGQILVPFPAESALSGVAKPVGRDQTLWYRRTVTIPSTFRGKQVLLHFGAVDWLCDVYVNGKSAGTHEGGYDPFVMDITNLLRKSGTQEIVVSVWDPSDYGPQPRGKQIDKPESIWYTSVTGIWQTVWLEAVPDTYITSTKHISNIDNKTLTVDVAVSGLQRGDKIRVSAWDGSNRITEKETTTRSTVLEIPNPKLWSPENPYLYDLKIAVMRQGKAVDQVSGYFAMRKISMKPDASGVQRMLLNNQFVFQYGPLDQGWWPEGLYTAPNDEALLYDIQQTKNMGFNMIRKHVKVEPARWYYHCDKLGMLVWQDMPSGDIGNRWDSRPGIIGIATEKARTTESEAIFKKEWKAIMDARMNFPSIIVWVPFNEAWGQFKTEEIVNWTMKYDSSRLVNGASGGNFTKAGHIMDLHNYPDPAMPAPELYGSKQIIVLGEFGGLGLPIEGHTWQSKDNWGYVSFRNQDELLDRYKTLVNRIPSLIEKGLSAAVYTQTTDVEIEVNGLMTYDRKIVKMPVETLRQIHQSLYNASLVNGGNSFGKP